MRRWHAAERGGGFPHGSSRGPLQGDLEEDDTLIEIRTLSSGLGSSTEDTQTPLPRHQQKLGFKIGTSTTYASDA